MNNFNNLNFDTRIIDNLSKENVPFSFEIDQTIAPPNLSAKVLTGSNHILKYEYKVITYLYGRIHINKDSFFSEIVGYIHPDNPELLTYHLIYIDPSFYDSYLLDYSNTDFSVKDFFQLS